MHQMSDRERVGTGPSIRPDALLDWFGASARDLPWRRAAGRADGWAVLVSEVMLQQTPVVRVVPVYEQWLERWPTPSGLAADTAGDAVRAWGRLGYPRRALRLHGAARVCVDRFDGCVPRTVDDLRTLPGVGPYTAAAVATFAYGGRHVVLDTNVRRVLARLVGGVARAPSGTPTMAETARAAQVLPADPATAARWNAALMELGALTCTARAPDCERCPLAAACTWRSAGRPDADAPARRGQAYDGTDRQARGRLLAVLRGAAGAVTRIELDAAWAHDVQRARALDSLVADGLIEPLAGGRYRLPAD